MFRACRLIVILFLSGVASAAEVIPPPPAQYVNDYAGVLPNSSGLNAELEQFERATSNQILVAVYPAMQSNSSIEDYTVRIANNWKAGGKKRDNGAILFVFIQQRQMFIQVGYGLEGALPDALCKQIIEQEIRPHFARGDYIAGIAAGVHAIMAATRGEYKGNGRTVRSATPVLRISLLAIIVIVIVVISFLRRATMYGSYGRSNGWFWAGMIFDSLMRSSSGGGGFGGGGGSSDHGGFSGGGGSFGGGGAGGSW